MVHRDEGASLLDSPFYSPKDFFESTVQSKVENIFNLLAHMYSEEHEDSQIELHFYVVVLAFAS